MTLPPTGALALGLSLLFFGCRESEPAVGAPNAQAKFGVFFGGQVQERAEIPFELNRTRQAQGLRIELAQALPHAATIKWEISMPGTTRRVRDLKGRRGAGRVTRVEQGTLPAGARRFERPLEFQPGDPMGLWNIRAEFDGRLILDQRVLVYNSRRRARKLADGGS